LNGRLRVPSGLIPKACWRPHLARKGGGNPICLVRKDRKKWAEFSKAADYSLRPIFSSSPFFEESLCVQRGNATRAGSGDGLAVDMVLHVARG
jgi:hypothetical protein